MLRLRAVLLERDERRTLLTLGHLGLVHLVQLRAGPETAPRDPAAGAPGLVSWPALLDRAQRLRAALGLAARGAAPAEGTAEELEALLQRAEEGLGVLSDRRQALARRQEDLAQQAAPLEAWRGLGIPAGRIGVGPFAVLRLGSLPAASIDGGTATPFPHGLVLPARVRDGGRRRVVVLGTSRDVAGLDEALGAAGFEEEALPRGDGTLDELAAAAGQRRARADEERARLDEDARAMAQALAGPLAATEARARLERRLEEARRCLPRTETALLLEGWIPAADAAAVERSVREATGGLCVLELSRPGLDEEDEIPVLVRASRLLRPFEALVAGFGLPRYGELSPTPFLAASFLLMFGVMFGDLGHGAVLAMAGLAGLAVRRWRDAGLLLLLCGGASAAAGLVYGSCFGLERFRSLALWRDPLEGDPLRFLALGVGVGVLTISLGVILHVVDRLRHREPAMALLDRFGVAGLTFYWTGLALVTCRVRGSPIPWPAVGVLVVSVAAWMVGARLGTGGRDGAARVQDAGLVAGLADALETALLYLANTISFVRLAAYGMGHAALLMAVLMTARAAGPRGGVAAGAVLVVGNGIAIVLEATIAAVQALRLEYYEFFGKFFSGAGRPFAPFRLEPSGGAP